MCTRKGAMKRLVELLEEYGPYEKVALLHSHARQHAEELLQEVRSLLPAGHIWVEEITPVLGAHIGPGSSVSRVSPKNNLKEDSHVVY